MSNDKKILKNGHEKPLSSQALAILNMYGEPNNFLGVFKAELQDRTYENIDRVFFGRAPILEYVAEAYGKDLAIVWLMQQYEYMNSRATVRQLDSKQLEELSLLTYIDARKLKTSEIQYFILNIRLGKFGDFFGSIDVQRIMGFLQEFMVMRNRKLSEHYLDKEKEKREKERLTWSKGAITREEYLKQVKEGVYKPKLNYKK